MSDNFYRALEERFRASREEIGARLESYRPFLSALRQVNPRPKAFDIGCGRGEWLQLLTEEGLDARGVDLDDSMLAACHERGLQAQNQDALEALQALPDESLDLISAFHVVEHLTFDYLQALLKEAQRTLSAQGLLILETPNAENLIVGTNSFYLDPTPRTPGPGDISGVPVSALRFCAKQDCASARGSSAARCRCPYWHVASALWGQPGLRHCCAQVFACGGCKGLFRRTVQRELWS